MCAVSYNFGTSRALISKWLYCWTQTYLTVQLNVATCNPVLPALPLALRELLPQKEPKVLGLVEDGDSRDAARAPCKAPSEERSPGTSYAEKELPRTGEVGMA